jgi:hypothetical protein
MTWSNANVQEVMSRDYFTIKRSKGAHGEYWRVEVRADGYQGGTIGVHGPTLEGVCAVVVEELQEARDAG